MLQNVVRVKQKVLYLLIENNKNRHGEVGKKASGIN